MVRAVSAVAFVAVSFLMWPAVGWSQGTTYTFDEEVIRGTIEKPEAFYILSPSSLDYVSMEAEESFLEELYETVEEDPF